MYSRLRALYSANWGMGQAAASTIYRGVFLPKVAYAAKFWAEGTKLRKSRLKLLSAQRKPLLAITGAYKHGKITRMRGTLPHMRWLTSGKTVTPDLLKDVGQKR